MGDGCCGHDRGPDHIRVERPPPGVGADVDHPGQGPDAGGIDEGVDATETVRGGFDGRLARRRVGDVTDDGQRTRPGLLAASTSRSFLLANSATVAPRWPSPMAMDRPSPLEAPTTTVLINGLSFLGTGEVGARTPRLCSVQEVNTGSRSHPRTVDVRACTAFSQSTSHVGNRCRTSSRAMRPSSRASADPRQKWMP